MNIYQIQVPTFIDTGVTLLSITVVIIIIAVVMHTLKFNVILLTAYCHVIM